jgi:hypothetical protein
MNRRILAFCFTALFLGSLISCSSSNSGPAGSVNSGNLLVQMVQGPPASLTAGNQVGLAANVLNDSQNAGVTWSCTPVGACGTFSPSTTGYEITTLYTAPVAPPNSPVTANLNYPVTITATSVTDTSQSASATLTVPQVYSFVLAGNGSYGMVGSVTLDGNGNIIAGEADDSANGFYSTIPSITGTYALDSTGHGYISMSLNQTSCCGTLQQTHGITATSNSHLVMAEDDQFWGLTIGGVGSMDLQTSTGAYSLSQISGGYSFTLAGYSHAFGANGSWGGIFTADGAGNITNGTFDENTGGGTGYSSVSFTGTVGAPDANGRGVITLSATPDTPGQSTQFAYYIVTPEVLRLTSITNTSNAGNTGSAFGQGSVSGTDAAVTGNFVFSDFGFTSDANGGESGAAAGQFTADGNGNITAGIFDLNANGVASSSSLTGSTYSISGSPRGTFTASSGQTYNVYLTDPNLNLLDPNNPTGAGGALLLETDVADTIGVVIPQTDTTATLSGPYGVLLSDQDNLGGCCNSDGGYTGQFTASGGSFSGEGDFQGQGTDNATPIVGPLSGTYTADGANPGRYTGTIITAPAFPLASVGDTTPGTENVAYYLANGSQGFVIETDSIAPIFGFVEAQGTIDPQGAHHPRAKQQQQPRGPHPSAPSTTQRSETLRRPR